MVVNPTGEAVVLDKPYAAATMARGDIAPYAATPEEVKARFGAALAAQPPAPVRFVLYFVENSDELTPASRVSFDEAYAEIARHPVPDIVVIGHTDRSGNDAVNDALAAPARAIRARRARAPRRAGGQRRRVRPRQARTAGADARRRARAAQPARRDRRALTRAPVRVADRVRGGRLLPSTPHHAGAPAPIWLGPRA